MNSNLNKSVGTVTVVESLWQIHFASRVFLGCTSPRRSTDALTFISFNFYFGFAVFEAVGAGASISGDAAPAFGRSRLRLN
jgi:hypothetical protein